jgi:multidrug efflux pump subunit AcrA (membrane-fusion protein)
LHSDDRYVPKLLKFLIPLAILGAGYAAFAALKATRPERPVAAVQERVWRVAVQAVDPRTLAPQLALYGRVETPDLLKAAASGPARVAEVAVRDGNRVSRGDLLVKLDARDFLPSLEQARAQLAELEAQVESEKIRYENDQASLEQERKLLDIARAGVERAERLKAQRVGSDSDLDSAREALARQSLAVSSRETGIADHPSRLRALEARLASARSRAEEIALDVDRARVVAPFDGVVAGVDVAVGDQVKQDAVLVRLYALKALEVRARVPAPYQAEIAEALAAGEQLSATALLGDTPVRLRLERLAGEAQASGVDGLFAVEEGAELLRLGQMISLRLERPARDGIVAVPFQAVYGGDRLYALVDGRMRGLTVEPLGSWIDGDGDERLLVQAPGLAAGDRVVVTHMPNAVDGLRVEVVE